MSRYLNSYKCTIQLFGRVTRGPCNLYVPKRSHPLIHKLALDCRRNASVIGFCVKFLSQTRTANERRSPSQALTPSAAFSFSHLFALQREIRRLLSADGSKYSALNSIFAKSQALFAQKTPLAVLCSESKKRARRDVSPVFSVSISYTQTVDSSIAKSLARKSQK